MQGTLAKVWIFSHSLKATLFGSQSMPTILASSSAAFSANAYRSGNSVCCSIRSACFLVRSACCLRNRSISAAASSINWPSGQRHRRTDFLILLPRSLRRSARECIGNSRVFGAGTNRAGSFDMPLCLRRQERPRRVRSNATGTKVARTTKARTTSAIHVVRRTVARKKTPRAKAR